MRKSTGVPKIPENSTVASRILHWGFHRHVRRFIRSNFNAVRITGRERIPKLAAGPVVCYLNHPGWWDPMTGVLLTDRLFPGFRFHAPMDAEALRQYPILNRLGFFPLHQGSLGGARDFLVACQHCLAVQNTTLWITPAGHFTDVRERPTFQPGLSHVVGPGFFGSVLPIAVEYTFWNERHPELLIAIGESRSASDLPKNRHERNSQLEADLHDLQDQLAELAIRRSGSGFDRLMIGRGGIGGVYDSLRRTMAWMRGTRFEPRHQLISEESDPAAPSDHLTSSRKQEDMP